MRLKIYKWSGINDNGLKMKGEISALNISAAKMQLSQQNIFPTIIRHRTNFSLKSSKLKSKHFADFMRQLAVMLTNGVQILAALQIIKESSNHKALRHIITDLQKSLTAGISFSAALRSHNHFFNEFCCSLVQIGEESGQIETILTHIAKHQENLERLKRKIAKALFYPVAVILIAVIVTAMLLMFVVPQFAAMFYNFGAPLPAYTQVIIKTANFVRQNIASMLLISAGIFFSWRYIAKKSITIRIFADNTKLRLPIMGKMIKNSILNIFCRTLAIALTAGLPVAKTLPLIANTISNKAFHLAINNLERHLAAGYSLVNALKMNPLFPQALVQIAAVGEEAGTLNKMLDKAADHYELEINYIAENLSNLLEPLIMLVLGILVGGIIIGMYLPIFKLGTVI